MSEGTTITVRSIGKPTGPQTRSDYHDLIPGDLVERNGSRPYGAADLFPALVFEIRSSSSWVSVLGASGKTFRIHAGLLKKVS